MGRWKRFKVAGVRLRDGYTVQYGADNNERAHHATRK
jgi:hypothetical protein